MAGISIIDRFEGESGRRLLIDLIRRQTLLEGSTSIAEAFADQCTLISLPENSVFIRQGAPDNDIYLVLSGSVRVLVNDREVACRTAGQHVGEMALVDPASRRTATVVTIEPSVLAQVSEKKFTEIAHDNSFLWRNIAIELCRRLDQRRKFHHSPNPHPILFVGSSKEGLPVATAFVAAIPKEVAGVTLWSEGVFGASSFPMEDLASRLRCSDFAVLVATADDTVVFRGQEYQAPRDNIVFELGLFMGALSRKRTFLVVPGSINIKIPSDLLGINTVRYNPEAPTLTNAVRDAVNEVISIIKANGVK